MKPELMNKWCKTTHSPGYYIKVREVEDNGSYNTLYGETIAIRSYVPYNDRGSWSNNEFEDTMVEVPLSEILQYLPESYHKQIFKTFI